MAQPLNLILNPALQAELKPQVWQDERIKLPRQLYPEQDEAELYQRWQRDYEAFFRKDGTPAVPVAALFAPAEMLQPRYVANPAEGWYALVTPRYNLHTRQRLGYLRYWGAASGAALPGMIEGVRQVWQDLPLEGLKLRLGFRSPFRPADFHPKALLQEHVVIGRLNPQVRPRPELSEGLRVEDPAGVEEAWWQPYQALRWEQKALAPQWETWPDDPEGQNQRKQEMVELLQAGGSVINLWERERLAGHISWRPSRYPEQLLELCWHIHHIIVAADYRRQGLGEGLHRMAIARMNLVATPYIAGIISAGNIASLKAAAKIGREVVDSYVLIPNDTLPTNDGHWY